MNVNEIVNRVVFSVKKEWSTLEKIRFVYLETGKYLVKDTDFFFSMDGKLDDYNLSLEELADIYNNENPLESNKVICRSSALILKKIYDRLGIKSKLEQADAIVIGAGAGLSTAAGLIYNGERFKHYFFDFEEKYGFTDMYSGGFYPYKTLEE